MDAEETALWTEYRATGSKDARDKLVERFSNFTGYLAHKACQRAPAFQDRGEIESYAFRGLLDAIGKFDHTAGVKFETYATRRISGAIKDGQRKMDPLPRTVRTRVKTLEALIDEHWEKESSDPPIDWLVERMEGETPESIRQLIVDRQSLDASLNSDSAPDIVALPADSEVDLSELKDLTARRVAALPRKERQALIAHYAGAGTMKSTSQTLGVSHRIAKGLLESATRSMAAPRTHTQ